MPPTEAQPAAGVSPVLDIGGDVGAVIVYLSAPMGRGELDIQPRGEPQRRFHTGIHRRVLAAGVVHVAVFPDVRAGPYELIDASGGVLARLDVHGGEVTEIDHR